jgi:hypothetical protein
VGLASGRDLKRRNSTTVVGFDHPAGTGCIRNFSFSVFRIDEVVPSFAFAAAILSLTVKDLLQLGSLECHFVS